MIIYNLIKFSKIKKLIIKSDKFRSQNKYNKK